MITLIAGIFDFFWIWVFRSPDQNVNMFLQIAIALSCSLMITLIARIFYFFMYWLNMSLQIPILGNLIITLIDDLTDSCLWTWECFFAIFSTALWVRPLLPGWSACYWLTPPHSPHFTILMLWLAGGEGWGESRPLCLGSGAEILHETFLRCPVTEDASVILL